MVSIYRQNTGSSYTLLRRTTITLKPEDEFKPFLLPNQFVNYDVINKEKGIYFDYATAMVAMLRSQNIQAKLVVGNLSNRYHAWVNVYLEDKGWQLYDPSLAAVGVQALRIMYSAQYVY